MKTQHSLKKYRQYTNEPDTIRCPYCMAEFGVYDDVKEESDVTFSDHDPWTCSTCGKECLLTVAYKDVFFCTEKMPEE